MIFAEIFLTFFQIGLFTFGGGYAMIPLIQSEVLGKAWLTSEELINFIAVSESTPGPFAVNISTYIGTILGTQQGSVFTGFLGGICGTLGVVMPSFIIILIVAHFYEKFKESKIVSGIMTGLRPATVGLIGAAVVSILMTNLFKNSFSWEFFTRPAFYCSIAITALMTFLSFKKLHPILLIVISAALGILVGYTVGIY
ncbi:MAG: chromate transporter [Lachnospiraceae bacterium]|nr:chromate transporter [Lachnospiraceae bacterium]